MLKDKKIISRKKNREGYKKEIDNIKKILEKK